MRALLAGYIAGVLILACGAQAVPEPVAQPPDARAVKAQQELNDTLALSAAFWDCLQVNDAYRTAYMQQLMHNGGSRNEVRRLMENKVAYRDNAITNINASPLPIEQIKEAVGDALSACQAGRNDG